MLEQKQENFKALTLEYAEVLDNARKILKGSCNVCRVCNGKNCPGRGTTTLEFGGKGCNAAFQNSYEALAKVRIIPDVIHDDFMPDTSIELFGRTFRVPVFAAPIAAVLTSYTYDSPYFNNNAAYAEALIKGCHDGGGMAWLGDMIYPGYYEGQIETIDKVNGEAIPTIKPWEDLEGEVLRKIDLAKKKGVIGIASDLDSPGLGYQSANDITVCYRSTNELAQIIKYAGVPVVLKGLLSVKSAVKAAEAGAYGILISNHGGNVIEHSVNPADVVEDIRKAVGPNMKIFVDGAVRSGEDVFKLIALGADACLIGRPYVVSVYGGGAHGAELYTRKILWELQNIMRQTDSRTLKDITRDKITYVK